jgi:hypothetical protein
MPMDSSLTPRLRSQSTARSASGRPPNTALTWFIRFLLEPVEDVSVEDVPSTTVFSQAQAFSTVRRLREVLGTGGRFVIVE